MGFCRIRSASDVKCPKDTVVDTHFIQGFRTKCNMNDLTKAYESSFDKVCKPTPTWIQRRNRVAAAAAARLDAQRLRAAAAARASAAAARLAACVDSATAC